MPTKSNITKKFKQLEKYGYLVKTFNDRRAISKGAKGFIDHLIIGKGRMYFIEVKIGKDKLSNEQEAFMMEVNRVKCNNIYYLIATENNYELFFRGILGKIDFNF
jgi:hypothetical protein